MKKDFSSLILRCSLFLTVVLTLTSCNLFIEEEPDEDGFKNVPVFDGDGYDAPKTIEDRGCEVTYQYNSDVHVVAPDESARYVTGVKYDQLQVLIEIHYRLDTPAELLPVAGEIYMSTVTPQFTYGACHRIQYRLVQDGEYIYIGSFAGLKEAFKELKIVGKLSYEEQHHQTPRIEYAPEVQQPTRLGAEGELDFGDKLNVSGGIADLDVSMGEDGIGASFNYYFKASGKFKKKEYKLTKKEIEAEASIEGHIDIPEDDNYYSVFTEFDFTNFSISDGNLQFHMRKTVDEKSTINIGGAFQASATLFDVTPVNVPVTIGPLVLVIYLELKLSAAIEIDVDASFTRESQVVYDYDIDLWEGTVDKKTTIVKDTGWSFDDIQAEVAIKPEFEVTFGIGIFGKVISLQIVADLKGELVIKLGVALDITLKDIVGGFKELGTEEAKATLAQLEEELKDSEYYKMILEENQKEAEEKKNNEQDKISLKDASAYVTFGPFKLVDTNLGTWYPLIDDNSMKVRKLWNEKTQRMDFVAEYAIQALGFNARVLGKRYVPAICLKRNDHVIDYFFPEEGNYDAKVKTGVAFHFYIPEQGDDRTYTVYPCYFTKSGSTVGKAPVAIDKGYPFNATSPHAILQKVTPTGVTKVTNQSQAFNGKYTYTFKFDTYTHIAGYTYMKSWGVQALDLSASANFGTLDYQYSRKTSTKMKDGTYKMSWQLSKQSNNDYLESLDVRLTPFFTVSGTNNWSKWTEILYASDNSFMTLYQDEYNGNSSARKRSSFTTAAADDIPTKAQLTLISVEDPDGEVYYY